MMLGCEGSNLGTFPVLSAQRTRWEQRLRLACSVAQRAPASTLRSVQLSVRIDGDAETRESLLRLSRRMAEEYGLCWDGRIEGATLVVRFGR